MLLNQSMLFEFFIIKALVSILIVTLLTVIAERWSSKIAGTISGYPTMTAISLFFFGLEISPQFASNSVPYNFLGVIATQFFTYIYYWSTLIFKKRIILFSSILAMVAYFLAVYTLSFLTIDSFGGFLLALISTLVFIKIFNDIKDTKITSPIKFSNRVLLFRVLVTASIIVLITEIAKFVGPRWAGLLSSFPSTVFPLILIIHFSYKKENVHSIIKNLPRGNLVLIFYSLSVSFFYLAYGVYIGTIISLFVVTLISILLWYYKYKRP